MEAESIQKLLLAQKDQKMVEVSVFGRRTKSVTMRREKQMDHVEVAASRVEFHRRHRGRKAVQGPHVCNTAQLISFGLRGAGSADPGPGGQGQRQIKVPRTDRKNRGWGHQMARKGNTVLKGTRQEGTKCPLN